MIPESAALINSRPQLAALNEQEGNLSSWTVYLDLLASYSEMGLLLVGVS